MFDPDGSTGHLHACPFLETWRALFSWEVFVRALDGPAGFFWWMDDSTSPCRGGTHESFTPFFRSQAVKQMYVMPSMMGTRPFEQWGERMSGNAME